jgi:hypothetical protein
LEELNNVAANYEYSLMWKMIGPHQALRLERMRTEMERDKFTNVAKSDPFDHIEKEKQVTVEEKPTLEVSKGNPVDSELE